MRAIPAMLALAIGVGGAQAGEGRDLYSGRIEVVAHVAGRESPRLACAGCHGRDASGGGEGRSRVPPIDRPALGRGSGGTGYDLQGFVRALTSGVAADGHRLSLAMPRYEITQAQAESLWDFLAAVGSEGQTGITPDSITLIVPAVPGGKEEAEAFRAALEHHWREHVPGTLYGRTVRFETSVTDHSGADLASGFLAIGPSFDAEGRLLAAVRAAGIPVLAPRTGMRTEADLDVIHLQAREEDVSASLNALARSDVSGASARADGQAPRSDPVVITDADGLKRLAGLKLPPGRQVFVSLSLLRAEVRDTLALMDQGVTVIAVRPAGNTGSDAFVTAVTAVLERALTLSGRDLTRARFLDALKRVRVQVEGWPELDFGGGTPRIGTHAVDAVRITR